MLEQAINVANVLAEQLRLAQNEIVLLRQQLGFEAQAKHDLKRLLEEEKATTAALRKEAVAEECRPGKGRR